MKYTAELIGNENDAERIFARGALASCFGQRQLGRQQAVALLVAALRATWKRCLAQGILLPVKKRSTAFRKSTFTRNVELVKAPRL